MTINSNRTWKIDLLGPLTVRNGVHCFTHFRTYKTAALLGYLAYELRPHQREEIIALIWPDSSLENGRNSLSVSLSSLRRHFDTLGTQSGSALVTDRNLISLNPDLVTTDTQQFYSLLNLPQKFPVRTDITTLPPQNKVDWKQLRSAVDLYQGRFLSGLYEDWVLRESQSLENIWLRALDALIEVLQKTGDYAAAQRYADRGIVVAPWREANHRHLIIVLIAQGQSEMALRHHRNWLQQAGEESEPPSQELRDLMRTVEQMPRVSSPFLKPQSKDSLAPSISSPTHLPLQNLPLQRTRFFGRRAMLDHLVSSRAPGEAISPAKSRLTTLTGMGGSGKTRLALEAAQRLQESFGQRVWFVPLAGLSDGSLLDVAVRDSLQLRSQANVTPLDQITEYLAFAPSLLILDNFEPLLPVGAVLISLMLSRLPQLRCIVTSRQKLEVEGEEELPLRPLPVPRSTKDNLSVEQLLQFAAIRLFVDRAKSARPGFALTRRNAVVVTELCRTLEGVPLALELAAARSGALSPRQMLEQFGSEDEWPQSTDSDLPARHSSMQAVINASYRLLPNELQQFFRRQWVFHGSWQPTAAATICEEHQALHFAVQLRACSMLFQQEQAEEVRFSCLETLRKFAGAQLNAEEKAHLQKRHLLYFLTHLEAERLPDANSFNSQVIASFRADLNNYRAALEWAITDEPLLALRLALVLQPWWDILGYLTEGRRQLERALEAAPHAPLEWRARAFFGAGQLSYQQEFAAARPLYEASLEIYRNLGAVGDVAQVLCALSLLVMNLGEAQAEDMASEALTLARQVGNKDIEFQAVFCLASILLAAGNSTAARPLLEACIAYCRQDPGKNAALLAKCLDTLGMLVWQARDLDEAKALFEESLRLARQMEHGWLCAHSLWGVSTIAREQGDLELSFQLARESIVFVQQGQFHWFIPYLVANLAYVELELGWATHAVLLLASAEAHHEILEMPLVALFVANHEKYLVKARTALTPAEFETLWGRGRNFSFNQALTLALQPLELIQSGDDNLPTSSVGT